MSASIRDRSTLRPTDACRAPDGRLRVAVFAGDWYPDAAVLTRLQHLEALLAGLGADLRLLHSRIPDPREIEDSARSLVGTEFLITNDQLQLVEDFEHYWRVGGERLGRLVEQLAIETHQSGAAVTTNRDFRNGVSATRLAQCWHAGLIAVAGVGPWLLHALTCRELLDLPLVVVLDSHPDDSMFRALLPMLCRRAHLLVAPDEVARDEAHRELAAEGPLVVAAQDHVAIEGALRQLVAVVRPAAAPALGLHAAYRGVMQTSERSRGAGRFVVIGDERTGSTMLVDLLRGQDGVLCADEVFNPRQILAGRLAWIGDSGVDRETLVRWRSAAPGRLLDALGQAGEAQGAHWTGFKLLYSHGTADGRVLDALISDRELVVIDILRRNRLRRWVSFRRAVAADAWYSRRPAAAQPEPSVATVELEIEPMLRSFALMESLEARYRGLFASHRYLQLCYEEVVADLPGALRRVGEHFGERFDPVVPRSRKTGNADLRCAIQNYDEVADALRGTRWQVLLEDEV